MTLVLIKPDAVRRGLIGNIIADMEIFGFQIKRIGMFDSLYKLREHYADHAGNGYYDDLIEKTSGVLVAMKIDHRDILVDSIRAMRDLCGPYRNRIPGTLRYRYAINETENSVHTSASLADAQREINIWFDTALAGG